jgi:hypothetical protein
MPRSALAVVVLVLSVAVARAAELPAGTWAVNVDGKKGKLVIGEVGKDRKVKLSLNGTDLVGVWENDTLTFNDGDGASFEAHLVSEQLPKGGKDRLKYTLTGTRHDVGVEAPPGGKGRKSGWYAQILAEAPVVTGEIKAEVRGVLVYEAPTAYVSVKRKTPAGVEEARIWVHATEDEWKLLNGKLLELNGKEVIVVAPMSQMRGATGSIPDGAMYFLGPFEPRLANVPKRAP